MVTNAASAERRMELLGGRTVAEYKASLLEALDDFAVMQEDHVRGIVEGANQKIFSWRGNREKAFRLLACQLDILKSAADILGEDFVRLIQDRIKGLLDREGVLRDAALVQQEKTKEKLNAMRQGKKALHGYGHNGLAEQPKYLSNRM